jgi:hypothetical protein
VITIASSEGATAVTSNKAASSNTDESPPVHECLSSTGEGTAAILFC